MKVRIGLMVMFFCIHSASWAQRLFKHPGVLHDSGNFEELRKIVERKDGPAYRSYLLLSSHPCASSEYVMKGPFRTISRDGEFKYTKTLMEADFSAAYLNAIMWMLTKDRRHAQKTMQILSAYADSLKLIPPTNDAPLLAGLEGFKIIYAAEALKYSYTQADEKEARKVRKLIEDLFIPVLDKFYRTPAYTNGNWGAIVTKTYLAAAIYLDDGVMFQKAVDFYLGANDNGTIQNYIDRSTGQIQESGRDQGHSQLGVGAMATICEIAYKQGVDLYGAFDNRLMQGFEYVAAYNLGKDNVPFRTWVDVTGKYNDWTTISSIGRGRFIPIYEMVYNHYVKRKKLTMPNTLKVIEKVGIEGFDRDQPGFGTFLFSSR